MGQKLAVQFRVGAFPVGFKGNCQDFANELVELMEGEIDMQTGGLFSAQYGGPQPATDIGPWWKAGTDLYVFDYSTGQYQPMEDQTPIGSCILWAGAGAPTNYLLCQGQQVSRSQYSRLFQRIGGTWGAGDGANTFNLPACGKYIMSAGYDGISGNTFYAGTVGGSDKYTIYHWNLPELSVTAYGVAAKVMGGQGAPGVYGLSNGITDTPLATWPVFSSGVALQSRAAVPLGIQPPWMVMNLCIRAT